MTQGSRFLGLQLRFGRETPRGPNPGVIVDGHGVLQKRVFPRLHWPESRPFEKAPACAPARATGGWPVPAAENLEHATLPDRLARAR